MRQLIAFCFGAFLVLSMSAAPRAAEPDPAVWQATIIGQLEAFRQGDAPAALSFAGESFRAQFRNPDSFIGFVIETGYGPLVASASHTFGAFEEVQPGVIAQTVLVVGVDQKRFEAVYLLREEPVGWRVLGVTLRAAPGLAV